MAHLERDSGRPRQDVSPLFDQALALFQSGCLAQAQGIIRSLLAYEPKNAGALHLMGVVLSQQGNHTEGLRFIDTALQIERGSASIYNSRANILVALKRFDEALANFETAIVLNPRYAVAFGNRGNVYQELGRFDDAIASYDKAIALDPDDAEAFYNRGCALQELKRFDEAVVSYDKAIAIRSDYAEAFSNHGTALQALGRHSEAVTSYDRAIAVRPDFPEALCSRGSAFQELKRFDEALASYDRAIALRPDFADAFNNRGAVLRELRRLDEALVSCDRAIALKPDFADAFNNRGLVLGEQQCLDEALANYDRAIALKPDFADAFNNRGNALRNLNRFDEALASYDRAITLKPDYAVAFCNRGSVLMEQGRWADAVVQHQRALALKPDYIEAKLALCMTQLPVLYRDESEIPVRRAAYRECLQALRNDFGKGERPCDWANAIGSSQPFLLAYQGYNDRDLQSLYGTLVCQIMAEKYPPPAALSTPPRSSEPIRLGIVSGFFQQHSNWKIPIKGWVSQLDRRRFRVFGYHTGGRADAETQQAIALCDRFIRGPLSIERWRQTILNDAPHVLIYPEVGMDPVSVQLAAMRLAPVQCNSWGHPETSGFPTLDYYISSELMEPPDAQDHYTERLVLLPNLSIYYEQRDLQPVSLSRTQLGLPAAATVYWCGQSLYKYLPQFDFVFPHIAQAVGDCQFVFIQYPKGAYVTDMFRKRLDRAFAAFELRASDFCVFLPNLDTRRFVATIGHCDIVLDSIGWSGCNSTLESLQHDLPIVAMKGSLMRGCHSTAILTMMGLKETITDTVENYIATAIRLARDKSWRMAIKKRISEQKHRVYSDTKCISGLEEFLDKVVRGETVE